MVLNAYCQQLLEFHFMNGQTYNKAYDLLIYFFLKLFNSAPKRTKT